MWLDLEEGVLGEFADWSPLSTNREAMKEGGFRQWSSRSKHEARRAMGLCRHCGAIRHHAKKTCDRCLARARAADSAARAASAAIMSCVCGKPLVAGRKSCAGCLEYHRLANVAWRRRKRACAYAVKARAA